MDSPEDRELLELAAADNRKGAAVDIPLPEEELVEAEACPVPADKPTQWKGRPQFTDQLVNAKYKGTWRKGPIRCLTFDIANTSQLADYNKLYTLAHPDTAPSELIESGQTFQFGDKLLAVVYVRKVEYLHLTEDERKNT